LRLLPHPAGHTNDATPRTTPRRRQTSHLTWTSRTTPVIKTTNHLPDDQPPTLTTDYYLARLPNGNPSPTPTSNPTVYPIWQPTRLLPLLFMYNTVPSVVPTIQCEATVGNQTTPVCQYHHGSIVLRIQFVFIVFAIYPKLLNLLLCCLYSTGISPLNFQTIPPWPLPRPRLSSRLVRRVVPERPSLLLQDVSPERRTTPFPLSLLRTNVRPILFL